MISAENGTRAVCDTTSNHKDRMKFEIVLIQFGGKLMMPIKRDEHSPTKWVQPIMFPFFSAVKKYSLKTLPSIYSANHIYENAFSYYWV